MKLIIGLGNPGIKYEHTRHNIGFCAVEDLARDLGGEPWSIQMQFNAFISQALVGAEKIILAKPQTFMNNSGLSAKTISAYYKIEPQDILVVHDEIDLALGEFKIQKNRGAAGHKGVQSIIDHLKTKNFIRLRIGIRPNEQKMPEQETESFVLQKFSEQEEEILSATVKKAVVVIKNSLGGSA